MSDDQTKVLNEQKAGETQPMLETILERVNALATDIQGLRQEVQTGFEQVNQKLAVLDKKLELMNKELLEVKAGHALLEDRVDKIERKPS